MRQGQHSPLSHQAAEDIAIKALTYLSQDPDLLGQFLALSGMAPSDLRSVISEPSFQTAMLDFLMSNDDSLLAFASNNGFTPEDIAKAKVTLDPMGSANTGAL
ncbi:MAG: DUF3572 domain-containing protein [Cohaesibacter sp.]|nr:DUF3572 domain-containing protein [Cohaesibacter sp.]